MKEDAPSAACAVVKANKTADRTSSARLGAVFRPGSKRLVGKNTVLLLAIPAPDFIVIPHERQLSEGTDPVILQVCDFSGI
jgi:hypothetical protein